MCQPPSTSDYSCIMFVASVPRPSPLRVGKHLKLGKAWDEASREGRRWVDALAHAAVGLIHKLYILARAETYMSGEYGVYMHYTLHWCKSSSILEYSRIELEKLR